MIVWSLVRKMENGCMKSSYSLVENSILTAKCYDKLPGDVIMGLIGLTYNIWTQH